MEIGKTTSVYQTQEVKGTKETYYKEAQKVDYSKYSADDLMQIPFEEAKVNQESIDKRVKELSDDGKINDKKFGKFIDLKRALNFSGNGSKRDFRTDKMKIIYTKDKEFKTGFENILERAKSDMKGVSKIVENIIDEIVEDGNEDIVTGKQIGRAHV